MNARGLPLLPLLLLPGLNLTCLDHDFPRLAPEVCNGRDDDGNGKIDDVPGHEPVEVTCDGVDNDCDGLADEGCECQPDEFIAELVECGKGECVRFGVKRCAGNRLVEVCEPGAPEAEECDGRDNDCDGSTDEDGGASASQPPTSRRRSSAVRGSVVGWA